LKQLCLNINKIHQYQYNDYNNIGEQVQ